MPISPLSDPQAPSAPLRTSGASIITAEGAPVLLRGVCLGGAFNMENYAFGFPSTETLARSALLRALGREGYDRFFSRLFDVYFDEPDAKLLASRGLNCVRVAVHYKLFEDDLRPFELKEKGFKTLDRVIERASRHGLFTVIDLHALPGFQSQMWHCDNPTHWASFWEQTHFQDRVVHLWEALATRYRNNPWVAGYNLMNEPADPTGRQVAAYYRRLHDAIRAIGDQHILFLDGNRYARDFDMFEEQWPNTVWVAHHYPLPGFMDGGPYPGISRGEYVDRESVERDFLERTAYMRERDLPMWLGEFGPSFTGEPALDAMRYQLLRDQLEICSNYGIGWVIWLYKDIGLQGLVYADPESQYVRRVKPIVEKKARLGTDIWGTTDAGIQHILDPIQETFDREFPNFDPFPFGREDWIATIVRHILLGEPMLDDFAACFAGISPDQAEALADDFRFDRCLQREELLSVLEQGARQPVRQ